MDLRAFRRDVLKKQAELEAAFPSGYCYITSLEDSQRQLRAGTVTEVTLQIAAVRLCERTHEISTPEQLEEFHARQAEIRAQISASLKRTTDRELRITTK